MWWRRRRRLNCWRTDWLHLCLQLQLLGLAWPLCLHSQSVCHSVILGQVGKKKKNLKISKIFVKLSCIQLVKCRPSRCLALCIVYHTCVVKFHLCLQGRTRSHFCTASISQKTQSSKLDDRLRQDPLDQLSLPGPPGHLFPGFPTQLAEPRRQSTVCSVPSFLPDCERASIDELLASYFLSSAVKTTQSWTATCNFLTASHSRDESRVTLYNQSTLLGKGSLEVPRLGCRFSFKYPLSMYLFSTRRK